ncbi:ABC transporter permease [Kitasatospora griseola]|uniref:ABC transporter permease n=1 Tax=Kitasatospora griseola TaxID=2064 RepID=UPI003657C94A
MSSTLALAAHDSMTMLRRNLKHAARYPALTLSQAMTPILMLLLFVFAFGDSIGASLGSGPGGGRDAYLAYLTPGILVMGVAGGSMSTSVAICSDMTGGIINRFRTMNIVRSSFMTGHVIGSVVQTLVGLVLVVAVALAVGFRPHAGAAAWLAAFGLLLAIAVAVTWLSVALGLISKTVESASNKPLLIQFLPFLGSAFVPAGSMAPGLRLFAEYQPFTPMIETLRSLLSGTPVGSGGWVSLAWCAGIGTVGYVWSRRLFNRTTTRR